MCVGNRSSSAFNCQQLMQHWTIFTPQVYIVSGGTKELIHVQLSSAAKSSNASQAVLHSTGVALRPFMVAAVGDVVVVAMESSDEVRCL